MPHSVIGKRPNTLLSDQKVPVVLTAVGRPVLVTLSLQNRKSKDAIPAFQRHDARAVPGIRKGLTGLEIPPFSKSVFPC